jgi:hypothetical protein
VNHFLFIIFYFFNINLSKSHGIENILYKLGFFQKYLGQNLNIKSKLSKNRFFLIFLLPKNNFILLKKDSIIERLYNINSKNVLLIFLFFFMQIIIISNLGHYKVFLKIVNLLFFTFFKSK